MVCSTSGTVGDSATIHIRFAPPANYYPGSARVQEVLSETAFRMRYTLSRAANDGQIVVFEPGLRAVQDISGIPLAAGANQTDLPANPARDRAGYMTYLMLARDAGASDGTDKWHRNRWAVPLDSRVPVTGVVIDPGHGGNDSGTTGGSPLVLEKDVALDYSGTLFYVLRIGHPWDASARIPAWSATAPTLYLPERTRSTDVRVEINQRVQFTKIRVKERGFSRFVSLHCNSAGSTARGVQVYYCSQNANGSGLANSIRDWIRNRLTNDQAPTVVTMECLDSGRGFHYGVIRQGDNPPKCPAALVELGFLSNDVDRAQLTDQAFRLLQSYAVHLGLDAFGP